MRSELTLDSTAFVTFYSFKGGVGRSMALINVAGIMAGRGFRVLALDMDLEAPGISYLMRHEAKLSGQQLPGFVDLLSDACERGEQADLFALEPREVVERYSYAYTIPEPIRHTDTGLLRIMPAGQFDERYQQRLDALSLGQLYRDGQGRPLVSAMKQVIASAGMFDFVFIDSRTGFSDESGICTRDLGDYLMVIMGLNRQNQEGTAAFLRSLRESGTKPKGLRVVLSPVPNGEDELLEQREKEASKALSEALGLPVNLELQIPYHPRLALTEEPHIFRRSRGYLYEAYAEIERAVLDMLGLTVDAMRKDIIKAAEAKQPELVLYLLRRLQKLDNGLSALTSLAGSELFKFCLTKEAAELRCYLAATLPGNSWVVERFANKLSDKNMPDAGLFYYRALVAEPDNSFLLCNYALFLTDITKDYDAAELYCMRSLQAEPEDADNLGNFAKLLFLQGKDSDAEQRMNEAWSQQPTAKPLQCELHFYAYCHLWPKSPQALPALKGLLEAGARSEHWMLDENVRVGIAAGHPQPAFLQALADVISAKDDISTLANFDVWKEA